MSKVLFLFLIFTIFQISLSLSVSSSSSKEERCLADSNFLYNLWKCDVKKDFKQINSGKKICTNVFEFGGSYSYLYDQKKYLEAVNGTVIKQWTLTDISANYTVINLKDHRFCDFFTPIVHDSTVDFIFTNSFGTFYTSWNIYFPNDYPLSFTRLTNVTRHSALTTKDYIALIDYDNDTVTEQLFSKSDNKIIDTYVLQKFEKEIESLKYGLLNASILIATFEDGTTKTFSVKYPLKPAYEYRYNIGSDYDSSSGSEYYYSSSSSSNGRYVIIIPIGLICFIIRVCARKANARSQEDEDKNPLTEEV